MKIRIVTEKDMGKTKNLNMYPRMHFETGLLRCENRMHESVEQILKKHMSNWLQKWASRFYSNRQSVDLMPVARKYRADVIAANHWISQKMVKIDSKVFDQIISLMVLFCSLTN